MSSQHETSINEVGPSLTRSRVGPGSCGRATVEGNDACGALLCSAVSVLAEILEDGELIEPR